MQHRKTSFPLFLFLFTILFAIILQASAETNKLQIPPKQEKIVSVNLNSGDSASGTVVVNGEGSVDFWVSDPQNKNVTEPYINIGQTQFSLTAETSGTFTFHVFNRGDDNVDVTLNYSVVRRIFGMPQEIFLLLVIVGVVLLMLIIWAVMSKA
jgi:hypothetical protein